jgi:phage regulator Rha-like protein
MKQLENKLSSREVCKMMEIKQHKDLLKKIDGISKDLTERKISPSKYWSESTYKDSSGKSNREFQITKSGCEFLAHKTTGTKGNIFTDRYMDRFEQMKEYIENGNKKIESKTTDEVKKLNAKARYKNAKSRQANIYLKIAEMVQIPEYKQIMCSKATEELSGQALIPLPKVERETYSATEIGEKLGISANKVGSLANAYNLKTDEYGIKVWDKSKHSNKQVTTFRYYENVIPVLKKALNAFENQEQISMVN